MSNAKLSPASTLAIDFAATTTLLERVCQLAGSGSLLEQLSQELARHNVLAAIDARDVPTIFGWMIETLSYQGISDRVARAYIEKHGCVGWREIDTALRSTCSACFRLQSYWTYEGCRYDKGSRTCAEPELITSCPVPGHNLRNGKLNQAAYSLYLFMRDIAGGDFIGWIDAQLDAAERTQVDFHDAVHGTLIAPLRNVFGLSDKVLTMTLSGLLMANRRERPRWFRAGSGMVAIDTLVHNFLHRSGILDQHHAVHEYGPRCYGDNGCAAIIRRAAAGIDARQFNPSYPQVFPRFVQHAIWRFCALDGLNICNGNMIDDAKACQNLACQLGRICARKPLKRHKNSNKII